MSDRRSSSDLGANAEATLGAFPFPQRDWESDARAIEARLTEGLRGSTEASLLAAPLPSEAGEPSAISATATPLTNSGVRTQSLTELARRSVEKKQANERQMARESLAIAAQQRQLPIDARVLREAARPLPSEAPPAATGSSPVAAIGVARANSAVVAASRWPKLALALPALALAAAALFWFRQSEPASFVTNSTAPVTPTPLATSPVATSAVAPSAVAENHAAAAEASPRGIDPSTLPGEAPPSTEAAPARAGAVPVRAGTSKPAQKSEAAASLAKSGDQSLPPDPSLRPADSRGGELPAKPSTGAVQAALGSVMGGARHCVAGDDAPSSAVVVFGSDGRVQRVTVSGAAAGTSSASCIEAQLGRARVQPFAAPNFSVNATVRPE